MAVGFLYRSKAAIMNYIKSSITFGVLLMLSMASSSMGQNPALVSANNTSTASANGSSGAPRISADGHLIVFESQASDLVANDNNNKSDVFVRNLQTGATTLVSFNSAGTGSGNGDSGSPVISADGRFVAFVSNATNLVAGVSDLNAARDVFIRDLQGGATSLVSVSRTVATRSGSKESFGPAISSDGHFVAFMSVAPNLVANDTNGLVRDVFVRDTQANTTALVSVDHTGAGSAGNTSGSDTSALVITPDGHFVAFESLASNLVASDTNNASDVFVRDLVANTTALVSVNRFNNDSGNGKSYRPVMSADGLFIAFTSDATNLVSNDNNGPFGRDIFLRDMTTATTSLVSVTTAGTSSTSGQSYNPTISADGRLIAFTSMALDLVKNINGNTYPKVYVRDKVTAKTSLVSIDTAGRHGFGSSDNAMISSNGQFIVFVSDGHLAANDTGNVKDVYVRDLRAGATTLLSVSNEDWKSGNYLSQSPVISADGQTVAFQSYASDLVANDDNAATDVFATSTRAGALQFTAYTYSVNEDAGMATITVRRTHGSEGDVSIDYVTKNEVARAGKDYVATSGTLTFADGETRKTFPIKIIDNILNEDNETLFIELTRPTGGGLLGAQSFVRLTIVDNDPTPALSISDVSLTEGDAGRINATFNVTLSAASDRTVSVYFATANGTAVEASDYEATSGRLDFAPGQTSRNINVPVIGDVINEPNENFFVNLKNATNATITKSKGTATINNNDPAPTLSSLKLYPSSVAGGNPSTGIVNLSGPAPSTGAVINLSDNLAATTAPASITIPAGERSKAFTIPTTTVTSSQSGIVTASYGGVDKTAPLTVRPVGVLSVSISPNPVVGGNNATGVVILERSAPGDVVVTLSSTAGAAKVPTSIKVPSGSFSKTFTIPAALVATDQKGILKATANGVTKSVAFTIKAQTSYCTTIGFGAAKNIPVGPTPGPLVAKDFNGDGKQDLAIVNSQDGMGGNTVSVVMGNGLGGFSGRTSYPVGEGPYDITVGDFNGDGKHDLAVANADSNNVSILLGNGNGSFRAATNFPVGEHPAAIEAADFNNDGNQDLAVTNIYSNYISILLGNGAGSFSATLKVTFEQYSYALTQGDFNLDGRTDLAAGHVSVLLGNGAGAFRRSANINTETLSYGLGVGDFNNDGKPDLVIPNSDPGYISLLLGNGRGGFSAPANFTVGGFATEVEAGDINQDGKLDLAVVDYRNGVVVVLPGDGQGGFDDPLKFPVGQVTRAVVLKDFNGDGKLDMAASYHYNLSVRLNSCVK